MLSPHGGAMSRKRIALLFFAAVSSSAGARDATAAGEQKDGCFQCHEKEKYLGAPITKHDVVPCEGCHAGYRELCPEGRAAPPEPGTLAARLAIKAPKSPPAAAECGS